MTSENYAAASQGDFIVKKHKLVSNLIHHFRPNRPNLVIDLAIYLASISSMLHE